MKSFSKLVAALLATAVAFVISPVLPASSSALPSYESRLSVVFTKTETGSGQARTVVFTAVVTDSQSLLVRGGTTPTGQQIQVTGIAVETCQTTPLARVAGWTFPTPCQSHNGTINSSGTGATVTYSESFTGQALANFEASLATYPIEVPLVGFEDASGASGRMLIMSSSLGSAPGPAEVAASPENDPGVSFAGFLIASASGRTVDAETAGTLRFAGKRLNQVVSATIGGIAVTVTSATRSALELDFDSLPEGKHDVVLTSKSGAKTTLRGFVTVN